MPSNTKLIRQWQHEFPSLEGKVAMVTGANRGIGKATTLGLATLGAEVIMVCRDASLGEDARQEIISQTGNGRIEVMPCDLASLDDARDLTQRFIATNKPLHILVNNAGLTKHDRTVTQDGYEMTLAVNHLAPFLLTNLLLDRLREQDHARIITVSSAIHAYGPQNLDDLQFEKRYSMFRAYGRSKLANILFTTELARRMDSSSVTVNSIHPGMVISALGREYTGLLSLMANHLWHPFMRKPEQGADTVIYLAASPEVENKTGLYWANRKPRKTSRAGRDIQLGAKLWKVSSQMVGLGNSK